MQALFQTEQAADSAETVIDQFVRHRLGELPGPHRGQSASRMGACRMPQVPLFARIVREAMRQQDQLDAMLAEALPADWPLARLDPVLRALLRAAGAELGMPTARPPRW